MENLTSYIKQGHPVDFVLDFSKAFDSVPYNRLAKKKHMENKNKIGEWISSLSRQ